MIRITHPRPELGRQSALGVDFVDGFAEVDELHPERELALIQHGYRIEASADVEAPYHGGLGEPIVDLTTLTRRELREIAEMEQIPVTSKMTRDQLIKAISETPASPIPGSVQNEDGSWTIAGTGTPLEEEPGGEPGTPFLDLSLDELRTLARIEGIDVAADATVQDIRGAFLAAGMESD